LAVERLRKVNALVGYTRIDEPPTDEEGLSQLGAGHQNPPGDASGASSSRTAAASARDLAAPTLKLRRNVSAEIGRRCSAQWRAFSTRALLNNSSENKPSGDRCFFCDAGSAAPILTS
jgi:hypothetical protein